MIAATEHPVISPKKLIEVALPLDAINTAAAREKSIRHGHPSTLHLWWARRPLAAARAVIFSQLVNDPEDLWWHQNPGAVPNKQVRGHWTKARKRLFEIIEELVLWENTTNEEVLQRAREEIRKSWREVCDLNKSHPQAAELFNPDKMPGLHDPFAGGGAIPLEAQRLGLAAYASDLNPVAVLINKAMIEIPPKFAGRPPVHPDARKDKELFSKEWKGAEGLAEDVRRYGQWMRDEAEKRIGHLYPKVEITADMAKERPDLKPLVGEQLAVMAWIWARTAKSPNPAFANVDVPLMGSFVLCERPNQKAFIELVRRPSRYDVAVRRGAVPPEAKEGTSLGRQKGFRCVMSGAPISFDYLRAEGKAGRLGHKLMAMAVKVGRELVFLTPTKSQEDAANSVVPIWVPETPVPEKALSIRTPLYGLKKHGDLYTRRQLVAMTTLCDLVREVRSQIATTVANSRSETHSRETDQPNNDNEEYSRAISLYLAFAIDKCADYWNTIATWMPRGTVGHMFTKHAIPMTWDYPEANPFSDFHCAWEEAVTWVAKAVDMLGGQTVSLAFQADAACQHESAGRFISTDPPYYDNIGYADLSDFFYVWLRRSVRDLYPDLCATLAVPKKEELVASSHRHGGKHAAEDFFLDGMKRAMTTLASDATPAFPLTIYYAFKQAESDDESGTASTGWATFLQAVLESGLSINGTWPMRTERAVRTVGLGTNSLASSIILVCRKRRPDAGSISRRQFVRILNEALPDALAKMTGADEGEHSPVAPVDLSQAILGPGMAIFSRYDAVLEADGTPMTVKTALQLINRFLAEDDFDGDTQFCLHWFEQHGWEKAKFGEADTLARAKGTSVDGVKAAGVIEAGGGNVRLLKWKEYPADWNPSLDTRLPVWEALHQLIRAYSSKGDAGAGKVLKACAGKAEAARQLAYRLYTLCERKGWAEDARAYNEVVTGWSGIERAAGAGGEEQRELFEG